MALLRTELENAPGRAKEAARSVDAAKAAAEQQLKQQRDGAERPAGSCLDANAGRRAFYSLAAANAELRQVTETSRVSASEQKIAFAAERDRAEACARTFFP